MQDQWKNPTYLVGEKCPKYHFLQGSEHYRFEQDESLTKSATHSENAIKSI